MIKNNKGPSVKLLILVLGCILFTGNANAQLFKKLFGKKKHTAESEKVAKSRPKTYGDVINKSFTSYKGLFSVHKNKDTIYFEIPDSILHRDIMMINRLTKSTFGSGAYPGEEIDDKTIQFELGPDSTLRIVYNLVASEADSSSNIYKSVNKSNRNPVAYVFPITFCGKDCKNYIIDVSKLFKEASFLNAINPQSTVARTIQDPSEFKLAYVHAYPTNIEIGVNQNVGIKESSALFGNVQQGNIQTTNSFIMLPKIPMMRRYADDRIGFFANIVLPFSDDQQRVEWKKFIVRWRLEPKDGDLEKWKRGELVEPQKPIIIYIDPAAPKQWHSYLIQGINDWQKAFEQAGFKNAIVGKEWPESDTTMHMDDARYSFLNYFPSETENAYGPNVNDPRSGEIIQTHIGWYANVMNLLHNWYQIQAGAVDPRARKPKFDDELMGELIRFVSSHEVGHTLGLAHNFGSSSRTPVDSLRNKAYVEKYGHTASIMDYARFNYVAQPEDNISEKGIFPRIGDYDKWAIEWGYKPTLAGNADEDEKIVRKWADERLTNPRLWFGDGESPGLKYDPRAQTEDLSDNPVKASSYGIKNLKRILPKLPEWTFEEGNLNKNLSEAYNALRDQYYRYLNHVLKYVGGYYRNSYSNNQKDAVYVAEPKELQREVLSFFDEELFKTPTWLMDKTVLDKIQAQDPVRFINLMQLKTLNSLLDINKLNKIRLNYARFGDKCYSLEHYITTLHNMVWRELKSPDGVNEDRYRRDLQKTYFGAMAEVINNPYEIAENDAASLIKADLKLLEREILKAIPKTTDVVTRYHLIDMQKRVKQALEIKTNS